MFKTTLVLFVFVLFFSTTLRAQSFDITAAGELKLETDEITPGTVTEYFGMNVSGSGAAGLRIGVGDQTADDTYTFKTNPTQLYSYLFSTNGSQLIDEAGALFRRGVFGEVTVAVLEESGTVSDSVTINLNLTYPRSNCRKYTSRRLKSCTRVDLSKATTAQRKKFAQVFVQSIRGPIVLEPKHRQKAESVSFPR